MTKHHMPLVSVIMPVRNGSQFMREAIDSIVNQTYQHFELLIVDDASTDETPQILKEYKKAYPAKIHLFHTTRNVGAFAAANIAYRKAKGEYIAPMDSDDISHPKRLEKQVAYLEMHPDITLVGSFARIINAYGKITGYKRYETEHINIYKQFALVNPIVHPACMMRSAKIPHKKFLYYTNFGVNSDYYTLFSLLVNGKFANIPEYLLSYRVHGNNSSLQNLKQKFFTISKARFSAVTNFGYRFPLSAMPSVLLQYSAVLCIPDALLLPVYLTLRGMKQPKPIISYRMHENNALLIHIKKKFIIPWYMAIRNMPYDIKSIQRFLLKKIRCVDISPFRFPKISPIEK